MLNGALFAKLSLYWPWFVVSGILTTIGGGLLVTLSPDTESARIYGYSVIVGVGAGLVVQAPYTIAQAKHGLEAVPRVTAFISCGQMTGVALSISIGSSVLLNQATERITAILPDVPRSAVQASITGARASSLSSISSAQRSGVITVVASTLGSVFYMVVAGGALALLLAIFLKRERI